MLRMTFDLLHVIQKPFERGSDKSNKMFDVLGDRELEIH
jgi:hypothetical protein